MDSPSSRQLATIQPPLLLLPRLQTIVLARLKKCSHVWKCNNWNKFLISQHHQSLQFPFQNLTNITLLFCDKIKYLFSPLMVKYFSNLKRVNILQCAAIEEVISRRDDENEENATSSTLFPHLENIYLVDLPCLKSVDNRSRSNNISSNMTHVLSQSVQVIGACWSLCQFPKEIFIEKCNALSSLVPCYAVGQMKRLQQLQIKKCSRMTEVFESEWSTNNDDEHGGGATLTTAILKYIPQLSNVQTINITECDLLSHIFNFSTLESLKQLKKLIVVRCKTMQVIVQEEKSSEEVVVFPCLKTLILEDLPDLKGFFLGMNEFQWPSLDNVKIKHCPNLLIFTGGQSKTPKLNYVKASLGRYILDSYGVNFNRMTINEFLQTTISKGHSFHNLIEININDEYVGNDIIPSNALLRMEKLQQITINECRLLKEVFEVVALEGTNKSQTVVKFPNLTQVNLKGVYHLEYLWKSNQWMVLQFPNLTTISIKRCGTLEHVFTCSMVGSLVQLQDLHISNCKNIEVIVKVEEEEEEECGGKVNEIILPHLKSLKLDDLPILEGFCLGKEAFTLPALETLQIEECPSITYFTKGHLSIPEWTIIDTKYGKWYVKPDLNSFIKTKQEEWGEF